MNSGSHRIKASVSSLFPHLSIHTFYWNYTLIYSFLRFLAQYHDFTSWFLWTNKFSKNILLQYLFNVLIIYKQIKLSVTFVSIFILRFLFFWPINQTENMLNNLKQILYHMCSINTIYIIMVFNTMVMVNTGKLWYLYPLYLYIQFY